MTRHLRVTRSRSEDNTEIPELSENETEILIEPTIELYCFEKDSPSSNQNAKKKKKSLTVEKSTYISSGLFQCSHPRSSDPSEECDRIFHDCCSFSLHFFEDHMTRHNSTLRCQVCEKQLVPGSRDVSSMNLQELTTEFTDFCTFSCRECDVEFYGRAQLDEHIEVNHPKYKRYECLTCGKRFAQKGGLTQHFRIHTGEKPFACTFCDKRFSQMSNRDQHLRTHTKTKPYKCVICAKRFAQSTHLRQHIRTHTNLKPYECNVCGMKFKQISQLNFHTKMHHPTLAEHQLRQNDSDNTILAQALGTEQE